MACIRKLWLISQSFSYDTIGRWTGCNNRSGNEVPSITFSPSVQVGASLENPEINGGVFFVITILGVLETELNWSSWPLRKAGKGVSEHSFTAKWRWHTSRPNSVTVCWDEDYGLEDQKT